MKMKKLVSLLLSLVLVVSLLSACGSDSGDSNIDVTNQNTGTSEESANSEESADTETIKVGAIFPITGGNADQGIFNVDGCNLAIKHINDNGGIKSMNGAKLELVVYDNMSDPDQAKAVAERMLNENPDIVAVTGAAASSYVLPMLPVFEKAKIPFLTAQVSESITNQGYEYAFRIGSTGASFSGISVQFLEWLNETYDLGLKKVAIVHEDTEWGISNTAGAVAAIEESTSGLEIVYNESFPANSADLSNVVVGLMNSGAEVVFPTCYTQDAKLLFNTMKTMNYDPVIIGGGGGFLYPSFAEELGDVVDGVLSVTGHNYDIQSIVEDEFLSTIGEDFENEYGYFMPEQGVASYGGIYLMAKALEEAGTTNTEAVKDAIRALEVTTVAPGSPVKFDETGANVNAHAVMTQWQKGEDGVYRTRSVFPAEDAAVEFQMPDILK